MSELLHGFRRKQPTDALPLRRFVPRMNRRLTCEDIIVRAAKPEVKQSHPVWHWLKDRWLWMRWMSWQ